MGLTSQVAVTTSSGDSIGISWWLGKNIFKASNGYYYLFYTYNTSSPGYAYYRYSSTVAGLSSATPVQLTAYGVDKIDTALNGTSLGISIDSSSDTVRYIGCTINAGGTITIDTDHEVVPATSRNSLCEFLSDGRVTISYFVSSGRTITISDDSSPTSSTDWSPGSIGSLGFHDVNGQIEDPNDSDKLFYFYTEFTGSSVTLLVKIIDIPTKTVDSTTDSTITCAGGRARPYAVDGKIYNAGFGSNIGSPTFRYNAVCVEYDDGSWSSVNAGEVSDTESSGITLGTDNSGLYMFTTVYSGQSRKETIQFYVSLDRSTWVDASDQLDSGYDLINYFNGVAASHPNSDYLGAWLRSETLVDPVYIYTGSGTYTGDALPYAQNVMAFDDFVPPTEYNTLRKMCHHWNQSTTSKPE